ncbi:hypothetical protein [Natrinema salinisoli]|uniref:hypothetical protein n=1 Tax=Natrinema salinisoli TaxID=2878535 RepID=UPI001CEFDFB7|nr:hypothetical protein [Natrinema salinisoli]
MKSRTLLIASFIVTVLLTGAIFYPGALTEPYGPDEYDQMTYSVVHESTEAFNKTVREKSLNTEAAIPVEELSENQQRAFQEAKDQPQEPQEFGDNTPGRQYLEIRTCDPALILCDEYRELPNPSNSGSEHTLIEDSDGEQYLVEARSFNTAGASWNGVSRTIEQGARLLILSPYVLFLSYRTWTSTPPAPTRTSVGYGATLLTIVLGYPYLLMFTDISFSSRHIPALLAITWCVILIEVWRGRTGTQAKSG